MGVMRARIVSLTTFSLASFSCLRILQQEVNLGGRETKQLTRGSGCGQPQAGSALNEVLKLNLNDMDCNIFQLNQRSQIVS